MHFGKKVIAVYLAVKTQLLLRVPSTVPSRIVRSEVVYFAISVPILFRTSFKIRLSYRATIPYSLYF